MYPAVAMIVLSAAMSAQDPPCAIGLTVRAGAMNYDATIVEFNAKNGLYKVRYTKGSVGELEWVPPSDLKTCKAPPIAPVPMSWFVGIWQLNTGGGGAWQKNPTTGSWKVVGLDVAGAPPIRVSTDGTYEWVINDRVTVRGTWRAAAAGELKYGYDKRGTAALIEAGEDGKNWLLTRELVGTSDGRDRIRLERVDLGLTYRGNRVGGTP